MPNYLKRIPLFFLKDFSGENEILRLFDPYCTYDMICRHPSTLVTLNEHSQAHQQNSGSILPRTRIKSYADISLVFCSERITRWSLWSQQLSQQPHSCRWDWQVPWSHKLNIFNFYCHFDHLFAVETWRIQSLVVYWCTQKGKRPRYACYTSSWPLEEPQRFLWQIHQLRSCVTPNIWPTSSFNVYCWISRPIHLLRRPILVWHCTLTFGKSIPEANKYFISRL